MLKSVYKDSLKDRFTISRPMNMAMKLLEPNAISSVGDYEYGVNIQLNGDLSGYTIKTYTSITTSRKVMDLSESCKEMMDLM